MGLKAWQILGFAAVVILLAYISIPDSREQGILYSRSGYYDKAEDLLINRLKENPDDVSVLRELVESYRKSNRLPEAEPHIQAFLDRNPKAAGIRELLVDILVAEHRLGDAIQVFQKGEALTIKEQRRLVDLAVQAGRLAVGVQTLRDYMVGNESDLWRWKSMLSLQHWRLDAAGVREATAMIAELDPQPENVRNLIFVRQLDGDLERAVAAADTLRALPGVTAEELRTCRVVYIQARAAEKALLAARRICDLAQADPQDWLDLAALQQWTGNPEAALSTVEEGLAQHPEETDLLRQATTQTQALGRIQDAANYAERLVAKTGQQTDLRDAAYLRIDLGELGKARSMLEGFRRLKPLDNDSLYLLAEVNLQEDRLTPARTYALELHANLEGDENAAPGLLLRTANLLANLGEDQKAGGLLARVSRMRGDDPDFLVELAQAYSVAQMPREAVATLRLAQGLPGGDRQQVRRLLAQFALDVVYTAQEADPRLPGWRRDAIAALEATLERDGPDPQLGVGLVRMYLAEGEARKGLALMEALESAPQDVLIDLAEALRAAGEPTQAKTILARVTTPEKLPVERMSQLAALYQALGEVDRAIKLLIAADDKAEGQNREVRLALADAYAAAGMHNRSYRILDALARSGDVQSWLDAANRRLWRDDRMAELEVLQEARKRYPDNQILLARELAALAGLGRTDEAKALAAKIDPATLEGTTDDWRAVAGGLSAAGVYPKAEALYRRILATEPKDGETWLDLAFLYGAMTEPVKGMDALRRAEESGSRLAKSRLAEARARLRLAWVAQLPTDSPDLAHARRKAVEALEAALALQPNPDLEVELARMYLALKDEDAARKVMARLKKLPPALSVTLATYLVEEDRLEEARRVIAPIEPTPTMTPETIGAMAYVWQALDAPKRALDLYILADQRAEGENDDLRVALADAYIADRRIDEGYAILDARARAPKASAEAWIDAANRRLWRRDIEGQLALLDQGLAKHPRSRHLQALRVAALAALGRREAAEAMAAKLDLRDARASAAEWRALGSAMAGIERWGRARDFYRLALASNPKDRTVLKDLAGVYVQLDATGRAIRLYRDYLSKAKEDAVTWYELGLAKTEAGAVGRRDFARAAALLRRKRALGDELDSDQWATLARSDLQLGRQRSGFAAYRRAMTAEPPNPDFGIDLADQYMIRGMLSDADAVLQEVRAKYPENVRMRRTLATLRVRQERLDEALTMLTALHAQRPEDRAILADLAYVQDLLGQWRRSARNYRRATEARIR